MTREAAPRTAAGRALHQHLREVHEAGYIGGTTWERIDRGILAIEAEAHEEGMQWQLERQLHDEQNPVPDVLVGPTPRPALDAPQEGEG